MQTPQQLRKQAAKLKQIAQHASGPAYHQDMQRAQALITQAKELEAKNQKRSLSVPDNSDTSAIPGGRNKQAASNLRNKDLAKIHLLSKKAGLDDDGRRDMMDQITGKRSSGTMNAFERGKVITHLQNTVPNQKKGSFPGKPNNLDNNQQIQKIEALLAEAKYPWSYAKAIAKRMYQKDSLEFCSSVELSGVINALIKDAKKHGRKTS
ncbi:MAG: DUF1018 domain-containing protein [Methylomarinum sp.]|nr:DUF1018 domain-containing protein [Methylomarinum sp.]